MCQENLGPREFETALPENICWITERSMTAFGNLVVRIASDVPHLSVGTACKNHAACSYGYFNIWAFDQSETWIYCTFLYEWVDSACFAPLSMWEFHDTGHNVLRNQTAFLERIRVPYRHFSSWRQCARWLILNQGQAPGEVAEFKDQVQNPRNLKAKILVSIECAWLADNQLSWRYGAFAIFENRN